MIAATLLLATAQSGGFFPEGTVDATLIILNDDVLTASELDARVRRFMAREPRATVQDATTYALHRSFRIMLAWEGFRRFGLDRRLLDERASERVDELIAGAGSRARFSTDIARDGYASIDAFREAVRDELALQTWQNMVLGHQPTPTKGFRFELEVAPEDLRRAYEEQLEEWNVEGSLEWVTLQFHSDAERDGMATAEEVATLLRNGSMTLDQAMDLASATIPGEGDPEELGLRPDLVEFLRDAEEGDVSAPTEIPGVGAQCMVVRKRTEPHQVPFAKAQRELRLELIEERGNEVLDRAFRELARTSYLWHVEFLAPFVALYTGETEPTTPEEL